MKNQMTFKRYELKYLLTRGQHKEILKVMQDHMVLDCFGHTTIRNIYYDTNTFRLIRRSIEKPAYKEKLRVRSYQRVDAEDPVFVELKKKYKSVVYKRRLTLPQKDVFSCLANHQPLPVHTQIASEINYFCDYYQSLEPAVFLSYEREAFYDPQGSDFRVTFDENILYRREELTLDSPIWGKEILDSDTVLMELKTPGGIPLWMTHFLTEHHIYRTTFSKYGAAYKDMLTNHLHGGHMYA